METSLNIMELNMETALNTKMLNESLHYSGEDVQIVFYEFCLYIMQNRNLNNGIVCYKLEDIKTLGSATLSLLSDFPQYFYLSNS